MLIGWSPHQASADPAQPAAYLLDTEVVKPVGMQRVRETRTPAPELLIGFPSVVQNAIAALTFEATYRVALLSFDPTEVDVVQFNAGDKMVRGSIAVAIDLFLELAFAGVPSRCRPPVFVGTHTHTGRLEINIAMPRFVWTDTGKLRSYNPHPPMRGSRNAFDALGDFLIARFGWSNPRALHRAAGVKGPDWAEKRLAAAARHGVKFSPETAPKLFFLQAAKIIAASAHVRDRVGFLEIFQDVVAATDFEFSLGQGGTITLVSQTDPHPLVLRGTLFDQVDDAPTKSELKPSAHCSLSESWRRRAAWNTAEYSSGTWVEPEPDWVRRVVAPELAIPSCHPDTAKPVAEPRRFARLADRLVAGLRRLRTRVSALAGNHLIGSVLSDIDLAPFRNIKNKLETINYDTKVEQIKESGAVDGGALRAASSRFGERGRDGYGAQDARAHLRDDGDQVGNGAARGGVDPSSSGDQNGARSGTKTGSAVRRGEGDFPRYRLDQSAAVPETLRVVDIITALYNIALDVFPRSKVDISMGDQGGFKLTGPDWEITLSRERQVTGAGQLSVDSYRLFAEGLSEWLGFDLTELDGVEIDDGRSPWSEGLD
ncbi:hypothetical protein GLP59_17235 [Sulfitobacter sp. M220]|uniref:hypothetical protein n=1 Tax=Sulfitobacter sp. M220 TaxID=2675333 RepID=UPI001F47B0C7|nr:hypothetical protein [Sulfitobacter sp. M220]MCF7779353.1 hypothetical protein [Sulfitobacter sp. M220]